VRINHLVHKCAIGVKEDAVCNAQPSQTNRKTKRKKERKKERKKDPRSSVHLPGIIMRMHRLRLQPPPHSAIGFVSARRICCLQICRKSFVDHRFGEDYRIIWRTLLARV